MSGRPTGIPYVSNGRSGRRGVGASTASGSRFESGPSRLRMPQASSISATTAMTNRNSARIMVDSNPTPAPGYSRGRSDKGLGEDMDMDMDETFQLPLTHIHSDANEKLMELDSFEFFGTGGGGGTVENGGRGGGGRGESGGGERAFSGTKRFGTGDAGWADATFTFSVPVRFDDNEDEGGAGAGGGNGGIDQDEDEDDRSPTPTPTPRYRRRSSQTSQRTSLPSRDTQNFVGASAPPINHSTPFPTTTVTKRKKSLSRFEDSIIATPTPIIPKSVLRTDSRLQTQAFPEVPRKVEAAPDRNEDDDHLEYRHPRFSHSPVPPNLTVGDSLLSTSADELDLQQPERDRDQAQGRLFEEIQKEKPNVRYDREKDSGSTSSTSESIPLILTEVSTSTQSRRDRANQGDLEERLRLMDQQRQVADERESGHQLLEEGRERGFVGRSAIVRTDRASAKDGNGTGIGKPKRNGGSGGGSSNSSSEKENKEVLGFGSEPPPSNVKMKEKKDENVLPLPESDVHADSINNWIAGARERVKNVTARAGQTSRNSTALTLVVSGASETLTPQVLAPGRSTELPAVLPPCTSDDSEREHAGTYIITHTSNKDGNAVTQEIEPEKKRPFGPASTDEDVQRSAGEPLPPSLSNTNREVNPNPRAVLAGKTSAKEHARERGKKEEKTKKGGDAVKERMISAKNVPVATTSTASSTILALKSRPKAARTRRETIVVLAENRGKGKVVSGLGAGDTVTSGNGATILKAAESGEKAETNKDEVTSADAPVDQGKSSISADSSPVPPPQIMDCREVNTEMSVPYASITDKNQEEREVDDGTSSTTLHLRSQGYGLSTNSAAKSGSSRSWSNSGPGSGSGSRSNSGLDPGSVFESAFVSHDGDDGRLGLGNEEGIFSTSIAAVSLRASSQSGSGDNNRVTPLHENAASGNRGSVSLRPPPSQPKPLAKPPDLESALEPSIPSSPRLPPYLLPSSSRIPLTQDLQDGIRQEQEMLLLRPTADEEHVDLNTGLNAMSEDSEPDAEIGKGASDESGPDREIRRIDFSVRKAKRVAPITTTTSLRPARSSVRERDHGTKSDNVGQKRGRDETKRERQNAVVVSRALMRAKTAVTTNADDGVKMGMATKRRRTKSVLTTCAVLDAAPLTAICQSGAGATTPTSAATATFISDSSQGGTAVQAPKALDEVVSTTPVEPESGQVLTSVGAGSILLSHESPFVTDEFAGPVSEDHQHQYSACQQGPSSQKTSDSKTTSASNVRQQVSETRPDSVIRDHERECEDVRGRGRDHELEDAVAAADALIKVDTGRPAICPEQDFKPERDKELKHRNERAHVMNPSTSVSKSLGSASQRGTQPATNSAQTRLRDANANQGTLRVSKTKTDTRVRTRLNQPRADDMFERKKRDNNFQKGIDLTAHSTSRFKTSGDSSTRSQGTASSSSRSEDSKRTAKTHNAVNRAQTRSQRQPQLDRQQQKRTAAATHGMLTGKGHTNPEDNDVDDVDDNGDAQARCRQETGEDLRARASDRQVPLLSDRRHPGPSKSSSTDEVVLDDQPREDEERDLRNGGIESKQIVSVAVNALPRDTDHHEVRFDLSAKMPGEISPGSEREDPADVSTSSIGSAIVEGLTSLGQRIMGSIGFLNSQLDPAAPSLPSSSRGNKSSERDPLCVSSGRSRGETGHGHRQDYLRLSELSPRKAARHSARTQQQQDDRANSGRVRSGTYHHSGGDRFDGGAARVVTRPSIEAVAATASRHPKTTNSRKRVAFFDLEHADKTEEGENYYERSRFGERSPKRSKVGDDGSIGERKKHPPGLTASRNAQPMSSAMAAAQERARVHVRAALSSTLISTNSGEIPAENFEDRQPKETSQPNFSRSLTIPVAPTFSSHREPRAFAKSERGKGKEKAHFHTESTSTSNEKRLPLTDKLIMNDSHPKPTVPLAFRFETDNRVERRREFEEKLKTWEKRANTNNDLHSSLSHSRRPIPNFSSMHAAQEATTAMRRREQITITIPIAPHFAVDERLEQRRRYDEERRARDEMHARELEDMRRAREEEDEREWRARRKLTVPRANPVPEWYGDVPKRKVAA